MTRPTSSTRFAALLLVAGLTFGAAACGSSESDDSSDTTEKADSTTETTEESTDEVAFDDWADEVNAACQELDDAGEAIDEPTADEDFAVAFAEASEVFDEFVAAVEDAGTPDEQADLAADYLELAQEASEKLAEAAETAEDDVEAGQELFVEVTAISGDASDLAEEMGLDECVDDAGTTGDTSGDTDTTEASSGDGLDSLTYESIVSSLVDAGFTEEESTCITDAVSDGVAAGDLDISDPESLDMSAMTDYVLECVPTDRLAEIGAGGL